MRAVRSTWTIGGIGLVLSAVLGMLRNVTPGTGSVVGVLIDIVFAASVLVFAFGLSRESSVVARRPLGVTALVVVALWPLITRIAAPFLPIMSAETFNAGQGPYREVEAVLSTVFYLNLLVSLSAALIAVIQIGRVAVVPAPWRWAPLWALCITVVAGLLPQMLFAVAGPAGSQELAAAAIAIGALGFLARTLGLGVLALVLAASHRRGSVEVFRST
jgi:hypothetical protein